MRGDTIEGKGDAATCSMHCRAGVIHARRQADARPAAARAPRRLRSLLPAIVRSVGRRSGGPARANAHGDAPSAAQITSKPFRRRTVDHAAALNSSSPAWRITGPRSSGVTEDSVGQYVSAAASFEPGLRSLSGGRPGDSILFFAAIVTYIQILTDRSDPLDERSNYGGDSLKMAGCIP
jgi:hypothetical protein